MGSARLNIKRICPHKLTLSQYKAQSANLLEHVEIAGSGSWHFIDSRLI